MDMKRNHEQNIDDIVQGSENDENDGGGRPVRSRGSGSSQDNGPLGEVSRGFGNAGHREDMRGIYEEDIDDNTSPAMRGSGNDAREGQRIGAGRGNGHRSGFGKGRGRGAGRGGGRGERRGGGNAGGSRGGRGRGRGHGGGRVDMRRNHDHDIEDIERIIRQFRGNQCSHKN